MAASRCCGASTSPCWSARRWCCWAPTAPARPRCSRPLLGLLPAWRGIDRLPERGCHALAHRPPGAPRHGLHVGDSAVFPGMTIEENIGIGGQFLARGALRAAPGELYAIFPALGERRRALAASLSGGQRKMLGIAKALAADPRLLIMDEPSAGLSPLFVKEVIQVLAQFRARGLTLADRRAEHQIPGARRPGLHARRRPYRLCRHGGGDARERRSPAGHFGLR